LNRHYACDEIHSVPGNQQSENDEITGREDDRSTVLEEQGKIPVIFFQGESVYNSISAKDSPMAW
jgi:hypothetical protein